uniref:Reverse transcriptase domain-containing protein n=1 Tax=Tanacetum cinerariifolium TaxID=118510 RepID=A0A6L2MS11_TANCI|nr:reverse transcriptase domain-containing protein [Tanacetum cinerariifolium]
MEVSRKGYLEDIAGSKLDETLFQEFWLPSRCVLVSSCLLLVHEFGFVNLMFVSYSDPSKDPSSDHIPPLPAISPFLSSTDDSSGNDTPDTPPSPTDGTPFIETTLSTQRSPAASRSFRRRVMVLASGQPIHHDHFASDDSLRDSSSSLSSKTSLDSSLDDLYDSLSNHSLPAPSSSMRPSHHLCSLVPSIPRLSVAIIDRPSHDSSSVSPSRKRSRSPAASVPLSSPILRSLSYTRANLLSSPKRIRSSKFAIDLEGCLEDSFEPYVPRGIDLEMIARGIDDRVVVEAVDRDKVETGVRGLVKAIEGIQRDQGHRIIATGHQSTDMLESIRELERVNMRLRDMMDVASQRVTRSQCPEEMVEIKIEEIEQAEMEMEETEMPLNFNGTEGVVGLTRWFEKMETVFHISNCREKYKVKYATCTLLNSALTWWNSHKRTIRIEAAYAMSWAELMKLMTKVDCPRNKVQKMEIELWNFAMNENNLTAYTKRF